MPPPRTAMRAQASVVIKDWASTCDIKRFADAPDNTGRRTGGYTSLVSGGAKEKIWIQPVTGQSHVQYQGLDAETSHLAFQAWDGIALLPKDRVLPSGGTYVYDVIETELMETHRMSQLKQVLRT